MEITDIAREIIKAMDALLVAYRFGSHTKADKALSRLENLKRSHPDEYKVLRGEK